MLRIMVCGLFGTDSKHGGLGAPLQRMVEVAGMRPFWDGLSYMINARDVI